jgi:XTP/dITP diphosphohydrolase
VPLPDGDDLGARLLRDVAATEEDAEAVLRRAALAYADAVRTAERGAGS